MNYKDEELTEWLSGKPEHVGEYNASGLAQDKESLRWWDGEWWSGNYYSYESQSLKNDIAGSPMHPPEGIYYRGLKEKR